MVLRVDTRQDPGTAQGVGVTGLLILAALLTAFALGWTAHKIHSRTTHQRNRTLDLTRAAARGELDDLRRPW